MELHTTTSEALAHIMYDMGKENSRLNKRVEKLGAALSPKPLFPHPISTIQLIEDSPGHARKYDKLTRILDGVHGFIAKNTKRRLNIICEA